MRALAFPISGNADSGLALVDGLEAVRAGVLLGLRVRPGEDPFGRLPGVDWVAYLHARRPDLDALRVEVAAVLLACPGVRAVRRIVARRAGARLEVEFEVLATAQAVPLVLAVALDPEAQSEGEILSPLLLFGALL